MMLDLDVRIEPRPVLIAALGRQLPFINSLAINDTAKDFQKVQRRHQLRVFDVRRKTFVERAVKITEFAHKRQADIHATIAIEPPGGRERADVLAKFEEGGRKVPREGRSLAIPEAARRTKSGVISRTQRPRALGFEEVGRGRHATVYKGRRRTFMIRYHDGGGVILQRVGRGSGRIRILYVLAPQADIDKRLRFIENAKDTVRSRIGPNFHAALERALRTAR